MLLLINPKASGGIAMQKWEAIQEQVLPKLNYPQYIFLNGVNSLKTNVKIAINNGERNFISAGGDGTLNLLINELLNSCDTKQLKEITIGALGLGSSNDFYKPFSGNKMIQNISASINFDESEFRDVGKIDYIENETTKSKYFIINSSIGITAEANYFFNNPDSILNILKRKNTTAAIIYAAINQIFNYKNFIAEISSSSTEKFSAKITNLGIIKNPNFSGNLNYGDKAEYENGLFNVHLCYEMNLQERLKLFVALSSGRFNKIKKTKSWTTNNLAVSSEKYFAVEFDGEIVRTKSVKFSVLQKIIKVCK